MAITPSSSAFRLDFDDLPEGSPVLDTYFLSDGILFSPGWEGADVDYYAVLITALPAWIDFAPATPEVSFYADARYRLMQPYDVEVWSGPGATGVLLHTLHVAPILPFEPMGWSHEFGIGSVAFPGGEGVMIRTLTNEAFVLPEPGSLALLALGFAALSLVHWRLRGVR
jgi:hypothetical protein